MSASVNRVILVGRLGQDPEVRQFQNGGSVANLSIATSERWTDKNTGEQKEQTEWHKVSLYNRQAEIAGQYLKKGSLVYIEGSLHTRKYTDNNGIERYTTEIKAQTMQMLGSKQDSGQGQWQGQNTAPQGQWQRQAQGGYNQPPQNAPQGYPQGLSPSPSTAMQRTPSTGTWGGNGSNQYPQNGYQGQVGQPMPITQPNGVADDTVPF